MKSRCDDAQRFKELPDTIRWICDGEVAVALNRDTGGITDVAYFGRQSFQMMSLFRGDVLKLKIGNSFHRFQDIEVYPFGIASRHDGAEVTFAVNGYSVMIEVRDPRKRPLSFLFDPMCLSRPKNAVWESLPYDAANQAVRFYFMAFGNQHRYGNTNPLRDDDPDSPDLRHCPDRLMAGQGYVTAGLMSTGRHRDLHNLHVFSTDTKQSRFGIVFGETNAECRRRFLELKDRSVFAEQKSRYDRIYAKAPKARMASYPALSEMIGLLPGYYESMKVRQQSVRATMASRYWVWGWDSILAAMGMLWAKDYEYVKTIIRFHSATAKPNGKIAHQYGMDLLPTIHVDRYDLEDYVMLALIARYFDFVRDDAFLREIGPFYAKLFQGIAALSDPRTGFMPCEGTYPDYPWKVAGRERMAYPCMEQTSLYAVCCQAEKLGIKMGNGDLSESARTLKEKIRANFSRYFYDAKKGWLYESVSLKGCQPNPCYPKWTMFGLGMKGGESLLDAAQLKRMAEFALKNFFEGDDLRSMPLWDKGAKLAPHETNVGVWTTLSYPVEDLSLYNLFKYAGHKEGMKRTLSRMERIYASLRTVPEIVPTRQAEFREDVYADDRASWQVFSMGIWHCIVMEGYLGLDAENGKIKGLTSKRRGVECEGV